MVHGTATRIYHKSPTNETAADESCMRSLLLPFFKQFARDKLAQLHLPIKIREHGAPSCRMK